MHVRCVLDSVFERGKGGWLLRGLSSEVNTISSMFL